MVPYGAQMSSSNSGHKKYHYLTQKNSLVYPNAKFSLKYVGKVCDAVFTTIFNNQKSYIIKEDTINLNKIIQENEPIITYTWYTYKQLYYINSTPKIGIASISMKFSNDILPNYTVSSIMPCYRSDMFIPVKYNLLQAIKN